MSLFLIAEIGINHNGDLGIAKKLIKEAAAAGFDAVKFQKRSIEKIYAKEFLDSARESPWGTTQREQKEGLEFGQTEYEAIDDYCNEQSIEWFASAWDADSQIFLRQFNLKYNKVASAQLANWPLLYEIACERKQTFISTGMSSLDEIDAVVAFFKRMQCPIELMHCNSTYPMNETDANLRCIPVLRERYGVDVGYSGHETTLIKVCVAAVTLGATSLERHITLDRAMYGSDQAASISTHVLDDFVNSVRAVQSILGSGDKTITESELTIRAKLRVEAPLPAEVALASELTGVAVSA